MNKFHDDTPKKRLLLILKALLGLPRTHRGHRRARKRLGAHPNPRAKNKFLKK